MTPEDQHIDRKSLRTVTGKSADWEALAKHCGGLCQWRGRPLIGMENEEALPPLGRGCPQACWIGCASAWARFVGRVGEAYPDFLA